MSHLLLSFFFFFNDTATTEIYTLSLHDALPIWKRATSPPTSRPDSTPRAACSRPIARATGSSSISPTRHRRPRRDRKSTRLNSSHGYISYAVFCLKKKKKKKNSAV